MLNSGAIIVAPLQLSNTPEDSNQNVIESLLEANELEDSWIPMPIRY